MAAFESIQGSPLAAFKHDLRERDKYENEDIDQARRGLNYTLSPMSHGRTVKECMGYYDSLTETVYHRGKSTITAGQWVVTAPADLPPEKEKEFFQASYDYLNLFHFGGDDTRCLLAQVHKDEGGEAHMHYVFLLPEEENPRFISMSEKCLSGIKKAQEHFGKKLTKEQIDDVYMAVQRYEKSHVSSRERYCIHDISESLGLKRDDARWVFTRVRRLESERFERRLVPKDKFLTREKFKEFHPGLQAYLEEQGLDCEVYKGGSGINLTVEQLKEMTRETGYTLVERKEIERLRGIERQLERDRTVERGRWD